MVFCFGARIIAVQACERKESLKHTHKIPINKKDKQRINTQTKTMKDDKKNK